MNDRGTPGRNQNGLKRSTETTVTAAKSHVNAWTSKADAHAIAWGLRTIDVALLHVVHVCFTSLVIKRSMLHSRSSRSSLTLRLAVDVKHAGRTQSIVVEDTGSVLALKAEISKVTGVPLGEC